MKKKLIGLMIAIPIGIILYYLIRAPIALLYLIGIPLALLEYFTRPKKKKKLEEKEKLKSESSVMS